jgi:hypothetical protein
MPPRRRRFRSTREVSGVIGLCLTLVAPCAAQGTLVSSDPHRHAIVVSTDGGALPSVFQDPGCGDVGGDHVPELGLGASLVDRPTSSFFLSADVRVTGAAVAVGCKGEIPPAIQVAPGVWETRFGFRAAPGTPQVPLIRNLLRAGFETPSNLRIIARATLGGGLIWSRRPAPMAAAAIALSSAAAGRRVFVDLEQDVSWIREVENRSQFRQDSTGARTPLADFSVTRRSHPTWTTARFGFEWPLP